MRKASEVPLGTSSGNWQSGGGFVANLNGTTQKTGTSPQRTGKVQVTDRVQTTANPQAQYSYAAPATQSYSTEPAYDPAAAAAAAEQARKAGLVSGISGLINDAMGIYDTLFGNVRGAAKEQAEALNKRYDTETASLTDQFNVELPKIGRAFAGRGAYDSSYRIEGEQEAGKQFQNQLTGLATQAEADKARIGQSLAGQEAELRTGERLLDLTRNKLAEIDDIDELMATQAEIQRKITELRGVAESTGSQSAYLKKFGEIAPSGDRMSQLQATLSNIINGQAPAALKRAVANQVIGSAGLSKEQEEQLSAQITQVIG